MFKLCFILIFLSTPCYAWDKGDTVREVVWQGLHIVDWGQTLEIARHPDKFNEMNPLMGKHPSVGRVNTYMGLSAMGHLIISYVLPDKYRIYWQWITIGMSGACVINNFNIGLKVRF